MRISDWSSDVCSSDLHCLLHFTCTGSWISLVGGKGGGDRVEDASYQVAQRAEHGGQRLAAQGVGVDEADFHRMAYQAGRNRILHRENDAAVAHVLPRPLRKSGTLDVLAFELNGGDAGGVRLPGGLHHHPAIARAPAST